jgi:hypothetical protein
MRNTGAKKRTRQEDLDSDYLFGNRLRLLDTLNNAKSFLARNEFVASAFA